MSEITAPLRGFTEDAFESFLSDRSEPAWISAKRRDAWQAFLAMPMPSRTEEEWMRTDIRTFKLDHYGLSPADGPRESSPGVLSENVDLAGSVATVNGVVTLATLDEKWKRKGVVFGNLAELLSEHEDLLKRFLFAKQAGAWADRFAALHAACWSTGTVLYVPRGVVIDQPLHSQSTLGDDGSDLGHTLVILDEGAEATFLNELGSHSVDSGGFHCGATEVFVGAGARLRLVNLQDWGHNVWHFAHQRAFVDRDASLQWTVVRWGVAFPRSTSKLSWSGPAESAR